MPPSMTPEQLLMTGIGSLVAVATLLWTMVSKGFASISVQNSELRERNEEQTKNLIDLSTKVGLLQGQYDGLSRAVRMCRVPGCILSNQNDSK